MKRFVVLAAGAMLFAPSVARAQAEGVCQRDLSIAYGAYVQCSTRALGSLYAGASPYLKVAPALGKCIDKYRGTWPKLVARYVGKGTSCSGARYADNGDGTFHDRLTRLTWEKKTDDGTIHDKDDVYSAAAPVVFPYRETGTAFATFLATLNAVGFGGSNGWRLPSIHELGTLLEPGFPNCVSEPCTTAPGLTAPEPYLSATPFPRGDVDADIVFHEYGHGIVNFLGDTMTHEVGHVRAVRSGS